MASAWGDEYAAWLPMIPGFYRSMYWLSTVLAGCAFAQSAGGNTHGSGRAGPESQHGTDRSPHRCSGRPIASAPADIASSASPWPALVRLADWLRARCPAARAAGLRARRRAGGGHRAQTGQRGHCHHYDHPLVRRQRVSVAQYPERLGQPPGAAGASGRRRCPDHQKRPRYVTERRPRRSRRHHRQYHPDGRYDRNLH